MGRTGKEAAQMKVGLLLECMKDGPDQKVLEPLIKNLLPPKSEVTSRTLGNKPKLLNGCGAVASELLKDKCDKVLIIWDLWPAWSSTDPCRKKDRKEAVDSLAEAKVDRCRVRLLCIEQMLESWLLGDPQALRLLVSKWMHPRTPKNFRLPPGATHHTNPKAVLCRLFRDHGCHPYNDLSDAHKISALWDQQSLRRLADLPTFQRLLQCVLQ
jgi:hypothetical protein